MAEINHEIKIDAPIETVQEAINTIEGLHSWYSSQIEGSAKLNGILHFKGETTPEFKWKVINAQPDQIIWECVEGPNDSPGTQAVYRFSRQNDGRTLVEFSHTQWPGEHGNFRKCNTLWGILLHHLKNYAETKKAEPVFQK